MEKQEEVRHEIGERHVINAQSSGRRIFVANWDKFHVSFSSFLQNADEIFKTIFISFSLSIENLR